MKAFISALLIASTATFPAAHAQTYQWKDSNGRTVISDLPPPGAARQSIKVDNSKPIDSGKAAEAPKTMAERDMDFKKRQQENREKADKEAKEAAANADRKENCTRARRQLAAMESGQRIGTYDANGERRFMEDAERQREIEQTRKFVTETCK